MKHSFPDNQHLEDEVEDMRLTTRNGGKRRSGLWQTLGGGSLTVSIMVHGLFVIIALLIIWRTVVEPAAVPAQFVPGGGGGGGIGEKKAAQKRRAVSHAQPSRKLEAVSGSTFKVPDAAAQLVTMSALQPLPMGGGGSGPGAGGGDGEGLGEGLGKLFGPGSGPGPYKGHISMPRDIRSRCSPAERAQKMKENGGRRVRGCG